MLNSILQLRDDKTEEYPIYYRHKNICLSCGSEGSLKLINIYGDEQKSDIHSFKEIICSKCNAKFSIIWEPDENGKMRPSAIGDNIKLDFVKEVMKGE